MKALAALAAIIAALVVAAGPANSTTHVESCYDAGDIAKDIATLNAQGLSVRGISLEGGDVTAFLAELKARFGKAEETDPDTLVFVIADGGPKVIVFLLKDGCMIARRASTPEAIMGILQRISA
jgi:hypothetical protein